MRGLRTEALSYLNEAVSVSLFVDICVHTYIANGNFCHVTLINTVDEKYFFHVYCTWPRKNESSNTHLLISFPLRTHYLSTCRKIVWSVIPHLALNLETMTFLFQHLFENRGQEWKNFRITRFYFKCF